MISYEFPEFKYNYKKSILKTTKNLKRLEEKGIQPHKPIKNFTMATQDLQAKSYYKEQIIGSLYSLYDIVLTLSDYLNSSLFQNSEWAVAYGHYLQAFGLLSNLHSQNFDFFKDILNKAHYRSPIFKSPTAINSFADSIVLKMQVYLKATGMQALPSDGALIKKGSLPYKKNYLLHTVVLDYLAKSISKSGSNNNE